MLVRLLAVLAALAGLTCAPRASAAPAAPGCSALPPTVPGTTVGLSLTSGGRNRSYLLHVPAGYVAGHSFPLIIAFHGRAQTDRMIENYSNLDALPAIIEYPQGTDTGKGELGWQGAPYSAPGVDDVLFSHDLIDMTRRQLCVDSNRIYATGKSNGAGFVGILGCRMSTTFAAIAPDAGAFYRTGAPCAPRRPIPVLDFHGTADPAIPYNGNPRRRLPSIPDWLAGWAGRDGCTVGPARFFQRNDVVGERWTGCRGHSTVQHYRIDGGGHTWPGATSRSGPGSTTQTISATQVMWQFFTAHPLTGS
ncbi:alpha/beta hydrolase family esterase [Nocardia miyunensis]|uniref:alpha/beta hydrolase family esterase n=1 Tax=Nocardia miyunensis TaxID=282684 RepID=UPI000AE549B3|nr:PHB depolymerase family esterase [Nocardia miyunensis]